MILPTHAPQCGKIFMTLLKTISHQQWLHIYFGALRDALAKSSLEGEGLVFCWNTVQVSRFKTEAYRRQNISEVVEIRFCSWHRDWSIPVYSLKSLSSSLLHFKPQNHSNAQSFVISDILPFPTKDSWYTQTKSKGHPPDCWRKISTWIAVYTLICASEAPNIVQKF